MKKEVDLAVKIAEALTRLQAVGKQASQEAQVFMLIDQVSPYELSLEDICDILKAPRDTVTSAINLWRKWNYMTERAGLIGRQK